MYATRQEKNTTRQTKMSPGIDIHTFFFLFSFIKLWKPQFISRTSDRELKFPLTVVISSARNALCSAILHSSFFFFLTLPDKEPGSVFYDIMDHIS